LFRLSYIYQKKLPLFRLSYIYSFHSAEDGGGHSEDDGDCEVEAMEVDTASDAQEKGQEEASAARGVDTDTGRGRHCLLLSPPPRPFPHCVVNVAFFIAAQLPLPVVVLGGIVVVVCCRRCHLVYNIFSQ
jgi:hypothetical protein